MTIEADFGGFCTMGLDIYGIQEHNQSCSIAGSRDNLTCFRGEIFRALMCYTPGSDRLSHAVNKAVS